MSKNLIRNLLFFLIINDLINTSLSLEEVESQSFPEMIVGYISLKFKISEGKLIAPIKIGTPEKEINLVLDIGSPITWISDKFFKKEYSSSYYDKGEQETNINYNFVYSGSSSTETFSLSNKKIKGFEFLLVDNLKNSKIQGTLSLAHKYDSKHKSITYKLSHLSYTFFNIFSFQFNENNEGNLLIGDITDDQKKGYEYSNTCSLLNEGSLVEQMKWRCELTQIFIGEIEDYKNFKDYIMEQTGYYIFKNDYNKLISVKKPASFETIFDKIYVPKKTMEYLKDNYLINRSNGKKLCKYKDNINIVKVTCSKKEVSKLKRLNFVLSNETAVSFPSKELFYCGNDDKCEFLVEYNELYKGYIFGLPIFKLFQITFDYNNSNLIFFGKYNKYLVKILPNLGTSTHTFGFESFFLY